MIHLLDLLLELIMSILSEKKVFNGFWKFKIIFNDADKFKCQKTVKFLIKITLQVMDMKKH